MSINVVMAWYAFVATLVTIGSGLTFAYLYHTRTGGEWRRTELGRHLMSFVLAPILVLIVALIRIHGLWWVGVRLGVFTLVPLVYLRQIWIFLKVQKEESNVPGQDH